MPEKMNKPVKQGSCPPYRRKRRGGLLAKVVFTVLMCSLVLLICDLAGAFGEPFVPYEPVISSPPREVSPPTETALPPITTTMPTAQSTAESTTTASTTVQTVPTTAPTTAPTAAPVSGPKRQIPDSFPLVLMYHLIEEDSPGVNDYLYVRPENFDAQLARIKELGYQFMFAEDYGLGNVSTVILTADDGYIDNYTNMFPILKKYNAKATIFLITDNIGSPGYLTREQIAEMSQSGLVSFQSHTVTHADLRDANDADLEAELTKSKNVIESITGKPVEAIAYPSGLSNTRVREAASLVYNLGFTTSEPSCTSRTKPYRIPRMYIGRETTVLNIEKALDRNWNI